MKSAARFKVRLETFRAWFDAEALFGLRQGFVVGAALLIAVLPPPAALAPRIATAEPVAAVASPIERRLDLGATAISDDARRLAQWIVASADNGSRPFVLIDKRQAQALVFKAGGRLDAATPVLLGHAAGDDSVPGIGQRPIDEVRPAERTTPAGRFVAERGRNANNEEVIWVDYQAAVSMHRVRLTDPAERRLERLASPTPADNRVSYGCINMPKSFFEQVMWPMFGRQRSSGVVYVLPEHKSLEEVFPGVERG